jgi:drug/metabolite transporter (DMT)-like permease
VTTSAVPARSVVRLAPIALLGVAVLASSSSAVLARWADAPAVSLAFWRTAAGALILAPAAGWLPARRARGTPVASGSTGPAGPAGRRHVPWAVIALAGVALGLHFATWLASLELTSVAASVTLVSTAPIIVAVWLIVTGRRPSSRTLVAIALALAGTLVITGGDALADDQSLAGDGLALLGAGAMAVYLLAGTRARRDLPTAAYASRAYAVAAACLLPVAVLGGQALAGYDRTTWLAIGGMVLGPQLAGHTLFNHLLGRLGAVTVSLALLIEPIGAAVLTFLAFGEVPVWTVWVGAPIVITGLALQVAGSGRLPSRPPDPSVADRTRPAGS